MSRSGAALAWEYTWGNRHVPKLLGHVQDRDLWKFDIPGTRAIMAAVASHPPDEAKWTEIGRLLEGGQAQGVINEGISILRQRDTDMAAVMRAGARTMIIGGHTVPVCNAPFFWASDIAGALAEGQPFAATYMDMPEGRQFSLRARKDGIAVNEIAEEYGGGGHPGAAGFTAPAGWEGDVDQEEVQTIALKPGAPIPVKAG